MHAVESVAINDRKAGIIVGLHGRFIVELRHAPAGIAIELHRSHAVPHFAGIDRIFDHRFDCRVCPKPPPKSALSLRVARIHAAFIQPIRDALKADRFPLVPIEDHPHNVRFNFIDPKSRESGGVAFDFESVRRRSTRPCVLLVALHQSIARALRKLPAVIFGNDKLNAASKLIRALCGADKLNARVFKLASNDVSFGVAPEPIKFVDKYAANLSGGGIVD